MKFKVKKYVIAINDLTNILLKKERVRDQEIANNLRNALIIVCTILVISIILNIYLLIT